MKRSLIFLYGVLCYVVSLATFAYTFAFLGDLWIPKPIDAPRTASIAGALLTDLALLVLFAVQHSVMARPAFKRLWTRLVPESAERSTYMLFSCLALGAAIAYWQPIGGLLWDVNAPLARGLLLGVYVLGWGILLCATFLINHFDLFGLRQVWLQLVGRSYSPLSFGHPLFYRYVRHPIYVGWLLTFWAAPSMTVAHLLFALTLSGYILVAIRFEERDLVAAHPEYEDYRRRVPMLLPYTKRLGDNEGVPVGH
jgi:methanethiol S-methyltransferase